jgi:hypothetical protein
MFHTLSCSEINDPHLRLLIAIYVAVVENNLDIQQNIMSDKRAWAKAIHAYIHAVTHYFPCKMELWLFFWFLLFTASFITLASMSLEAPMGPFMSM